MAAEVILCWMGRLARHRDRHVFTGALPRPPATGTRLLHPWRVEDCRPLAKPPTELRPGRWYPSGRATIGGNVPGPRFRFLRDGTGRASADFNHPLAGVPVTVSHRGFEYEEDATGLANLGLDLALLAAANGPGMQDVRNDTDFGDGLDRADEADDALFYAKARMVDHFDLAARGELRELHGKLLVPGMRVLDLMAGWNSHLPDIDLAVTGLGMNAEELTANPRLAAWIVRDLNAVSVLPFADRSFDAVLCSLSVEYLLHPVRVLAECARVLRTGGPLAVSFTDRWFPPKVTRLWRNLMPFERLGWVLGLLAGTGAFEGLASETVRGWPRPADDKYIDMTPLADPLYLAWGRRSAPSD
ncbi:MAG: methyltransferase domain-containing protein [Rhodocyclaceae bacterium]|nr:methyltransferase domain-containing protein [Rhodocyclaceae bacterium]